MALPPSKSEGVLSGFSSFGKETPTVYLQSTASTGNATMQPLLAGGLVYGGGLSLPDDQIQLILIDYLQRQSNVDPARSHGGLIATSAAPNQAAASVFSNFQQASLASSTYMHPVSDGGNPYFDFHLLERYRSDVASLARFSRRIDHAAFYLCVVFEPVIDHRVLQTPGVKIEPTARSWTAALARQCFTRWHMTRQALSLDWSPALEVEPLYRTAFRSLCELTPADSQLKLLFEKDRPRACRELVRHIDIVADQLALANDLADELSQQNTTDQAADDRARLNAVQKQLLQKAGGQMSLTQASERLGMTRQGLHKKIKARTVLGLVVGEALVVPSGQFTTSSEGIQVVPNLKDLLSVFVDSGAGLWASLQFLVEYDPALRAVPLDRLKQGEAEQVIAAARAYLGLDEG